MPSRLVLSMLIGLGLRGPVIAQDAAPAPTDREAHARSLFAFWDEPHAPGCAVAVMRDGAIVYAAGFGSADLEHDAPNSPATVFHVASVSKQFVAFAIALLVTDGALTLDDDVRTTVPELPDFGPTITLRHLIHHTSGLRDQWDLLTLAGWRMEDVITRDDVLELLAAQRELNFTPGTEWLYCNSGYTLLGLVVERASGQTLDEFCQRRIFRPLGMRSTHFHDDHRHLVPGRAESYRRGPDGYERAVLSYAIAGATSLMTTVEDLARWEENFFTATVGGPATLALMEDRTSLADDAPLSYGMGIVHGEHRGRPIRAHDGGDAGYACSLLRFPEEHLSVAVLGNTPMPASQLARQLAMIWLDGPSSEPPDTDSPPSPPVPSPLAPAVTLTPARLQHLAGRYAAIEPPIAVTIEPDDGGLVVRIGDQTLGLRPVDEVRFRFAPPVEGTAEFTEENGAVASLTVAVGPRVFVFTPAPDADAMPLEPADYAGIYRSPELDVRYEIVAGDGRIRLRRRKHGTVDLVHLGPDSFGGPFRLRFLRDEDGAVSGFFVSTGRVRALRFERLE